ncbi:MAG: nuclear transport factor 2 family protein [Sphingomonadales bacterium]|nr:MAG: nuclear transport factor 2 family protein [Sphingomonadales bacterium]TNF06362.1 MAG: nuclear transport factor 2 family protein [Sphingomonadales bacterium]
MNSERYVAIKAQVENLYVLTGQGHWDEVEAQMTDDFRIIEADGLPYAGEYKGKGALQELYTKVFAYWEDASLETGDITISEDHAIVLVTIHATSRHSGERLAMPLCEVFHLRGDKFCGITPYYFDTVPIARATGTLKA